MRRGDTNSLIIPMTAARNLLTKEEEEHKEEIIQITEEVLHAKGIKCDARLSYMSVTLRSPEISYYISRIK